MKLACIKINDLSEKQLKISEGTFITPLFDRVTKDLGDLLM